MSVTAADVINVVRDLIPDPVYTGSGTPQPGTDGSLFRSQTLLRFINDGVKALAEQVGWVVEDWTAVAITANQPWYSVNSSWHAFSEAFQNAYRLGCAPEGMTIWPSVVSGTQPAWYAVHRQTDHLEVGFFPVPNTSDSTSTLSSAITASSLSFGVGNPTGFLAFGYVLIDSEIIAYRTISGGAFSVLTRGQCATSAASHSSGSTVSELSAWLKGVRLPTEITATTDIVEIPAGFIYALQEYVLAKVNYAQNDEQAGKLHMEEFRREAKRLQQDPGWRTDAQGMQVIPYGMPPLGRLAWGNVVVP